MRSEETKAGGTELFGAPPEAGRQARRATLGRGTFPSSNLKIANNCCLFRYAARKSEWQLTAGPQRDPVRTHHLLLGKGLVRLEPMARAYQASTHRSSSEEKHPLLPFVQLAPFLSLCLRLCLLQGALPEPHHNGGLGAPHAASTAPCSSPLEPLHDVHLDIWLPHDWGLVRHKYSLTHHPDPVLQRRLWHSRGPERAFPGGPFVPTMGIQSSTEQTRSLPSESLVGSQSHIINPTESRGECHGCGDQGTGWGSEARAEVCKIGELVWRGVPRKGDSMCKDSTTQGTGPLGNPSRSAGQQH